MLDKLLHASVFIALLYLPIHSTGAIKSYKHIGCFKDSSKRAVPKFLGPSYLPKRNDIDECARRASVVGYPVFAVEVAWECRGGNGTRYNIYGPSDNCVDGGGGTWANDVYRFVDEILWPRGTFSLLKPLSGCPSDFIDNGWLIQDTVDNVENTRSTTLSIDGYVTRGYVVRSFCTKTRRTSPVWPKGQYCIYKEGKMQPQKLAGGRIRMDNSNNNNQDKKKMKYNDGISLYSSNPYFYIKFFCQTNGDKSAPIDLPTSQPFYLLPYGSAECQQVKWMITTKEWIRYVTRNYRTQGSWRTGKTPYVQAGNKTHKGLTMFYCLYTSCNHTLNDAQGVFQSPRYPDKYPDGQLCSWRIRVPVNHTVLVHFTTFYLEDSIKSNTDILELHRLTNSSFILSDIYKGHRMPFQVSSDSDLLFVFRSNGENGSQGFRAEYEVFIHGPDELTTEKSSPTTISITPSIKPTNHPTTDFDSSNETERESLRNGSQGTGTIILIVIPLVCIILIVVVAVDIYLRCRGGNEDAKTAVNNIHGSQQVLQMSHMNSTATVNTACTADNERQDTDKGYERLSHIAPRREVPEEYEELNRSSCPSPTNGVPKPDDEPEAFYHELEGPTAEIVDDDTMYQEYHQAIDKESCTDVLYERNVLYDCVA